MSFTSGSGQLFNPSGSGESFTSGSGQLFNPSQAAPAGPSYGSTGGGSTGYGGRTHFLDEDDEPLAGAGATVATDESSS